MSQHRIVKRPRAQDDLVEHFTYIAVDKLAPADRFLKVAEEGFERLAEMPGLGRAWESDDPRLADVRVYPLPRFRNYLVFYRPIQGGIEVLTILHGARDLDAALKDVPID